jgi:sugar phosphate isomerase/epimerase
MKISLSAGAIGVRLNQVEAIDAAARHGFEAVEADGNYLAGLPAGGPEYVGAKVKEKGLVWALSGLSVDFRKDQATFDQGIAKLPAIAKALRQAGVTRVATYILPMHDTLAYVDNLREHGRRLGECARILGGEGHRLGLEYVGTKTLWTSRRYPFVHSMAECKHLIEEIRQPNVGFVLDTWHWFTAGETAADLKTLTNRDIVACDLNDAPSNTPLDQQIDGKREMPMATGVIDTSAFLNTLNDLGFDGPVRCEPFNQTLRTLPPEVALATTAAAMKKAFALIKA